MAGHCWIWRAGAAGLLALGLMGCASDEENYVARMPREPGRNVVTASGEKPLQCVPYAREHSAVKIYGDAWTWWDQASGKFPRGSQPSPGAVMVLNNYAGPERGHVAVVKKVVSSREIRVDHANWLDDGSIYLNDPVEDVSADNDWSKVRVYNIKTGGWGGNVYPVQGFIGGSPGDGEAPAPLQQSPDLLDARATPDDLVPAHALARHAVPPHTAPAVTPTRSVPDAAPDDEDPLPHPDMVISANIP
jgi:surface antigen